MSFRIIYDSEATAEFREAVSYYEERRAGLGVRLTMEIDRVVSAISSHPDRFASARQKSRKARIHGWPYSIYFTVNKACSEIKVVAFWHGARNPAELRRRLR